MKINKNIIKELNDYLDEFNLTEIEYTEKDVKVKVSRSRASKKYETSITNNENIIKTEKVLTDDTKKITSPIIGTAYLAPEPGGKKFIEVGQKIKKGDTVMIVEAMKTMNHVPSPVDGLVKEISVEDGQPVEFGTDYCNPRLKLMFKKILIANRGEIAVRVIRACKEWGISTVAIHSDVDRDSMHVRLADESICVGPHQPTLSYLNIPAIMSAIELTGSEAVHPGYGFLSENFEFVKILEENNIKFIGPSSHLIKMMGDKIEAKKVAKKYGLPVIEGSDGGINDIDEAKKICEKVGFPVLIKASGGGGGKGMKIVNKIEDFKNLFLTAKQEAKKFFGNDEVYIEKFFQILDILKFKFFQEKRTVHLHERDCSVQRRHQKLIEETPSPVLNESIRKDLFERTVNMVSQIGYEGAGTVEFIYEDGKFYFLEMNTRVQVEHPVTEMVTGIDIIKEQIWIAYSGETALKQTDVNPRGHAIECRINAEDPSNNFQPSPGKIGMCHQPSGFRTRVDGSIYQGYKITPYYDSMVCKVITHGRNREEAIQRMLRSLDEFVIDGITTTIELHKMLLNNKKFINSDFNVSWLDKEKYFNYNIF